VLSGKEIARRVGVTPPTVRLTLKRLVAAGVQLASAIEMSDGALKAQLFTAVGTKQGTPSR